MKLTDRQRYQRALMMQRIKRRNDGWLRSGPVPARITMALDLRDLFGPEVDRALGVEEPTVDLWETGLVVPTSEQVERLSLLTQFPILFFYTPAPPALTNGFLCGSHGCDLLGEPPEIPNQPRLF